MTQISRRLRFEILRRDGHACRYCGAKAPDVQLEVDHLIPSALGGGTEPSNLVAACVACNRGKSSIPPDAVLVDDVARDALRWSRAGEEALKLRRMERSVVDAKADAWAQHWNAVMAPLGVSVDPRWRETIERFLSLGLEVADLTYLLDEVAPRVGWGRFSVRAENAFKYFCGMAWNVAAEVQEDARRILESEEDGACLG